MNEQVADHYTKTAKDYAAMGITGTALLAYRDAPEQFKIYGLHEKSGKKIMDLGCGGGRSLNFLQEEFKDDNSAEYHGVDVSQAMIEQAQKNAPQCSYHRINQAMLKQGQEQSIPVSDNTYDLVFSSLVLLEIPSKQELINTLSEVRRTMKPDGIFVASTGRTTLYDQDKDWISVGIDFEAHQLPFKSGDEVKVLIKEAQIEVTDFYWTEKDYEEAYEQAGFEILNKFYAAGKPEDKVDWRSEAQPGSEPFVFFVVKPKALENRPISTVSADDSNSTQPTIDIKSQNMGQV